MVESYSYLLFCIFDEACCTGNLDDLIKIFEGQKFDANREFDGKRQGSECSKVHPLAYAIYKNSLEVIHFLLKHNADPNCTGSQGEKPLYIAIDKGNPDIVEMLLKFGADPRTKFENGETLFTAAFSFLTSTKDRDSILKIIHIILEYACNSSVQEDADLYKFAKAAIEADAATAEALLQKNSIPENMLYNIAIGLSGPGIMSLYLDYNPDIELEKVFFQSIHLQNRGVMQLCIDRGVDLKTQDATGKNGFIRYLADSRYSPQSGLEFLVKDCKCSLDVYDKKGRSPVFHVIERGLFSELSQLVEINLNAQSPGGKTILHLMKHNCYYFRILLELGADPTIMDKCGKLPKHKHCGHKANLCKIASYAMKFRFLDERYFRECLEPLLPQGVAKCQNYCYKVDELHYKFEREQDLQKELERLQSIRLSRAMLYLTPPKPTITLYDVLFFEPNEAARYSVNINFQNAYEECKKNFRNKYTAYGSLLNYQMKHGSKRLKLMNSARELLHEALGQDLPVDLGDEIWRHLTNKKLKEFGDNC